MTLNIRPIGSAAVASMNLFACAGVQRRCSGGCSGSSSTPALYAYLNGQGGVRAYVQGTDDVSHAAISN